MPRPKQYLQQPYDDPVIAIVSNLDKDVEWGEDILMLGLGIVMLSSTFAPIAPPYVLLPLVALTFCITSSLARFNYLNMERKFREAYLQLEHADRNRIYPIVSVFIDNPVLPLRHSYNILKNKKRTLKSILGGMLINPFWMPIFYIMGIQIIEEDNLGVLNKAVMTVEAKLAKQSQTESFEELQN